MQVCLVIIQKYQKNNQIRFVLILTWLSEENNKITDRFMCHYFKTYIPGKDMSITIKDMKFCTACKHLLV